MADVAAVQGERVEEVWVGGEVSVSGGELLNGDIDEVRAEATTQARLVWERMSRL